MPIQVMWDNDNYTVIRYVLGEEWTWAEMRVAVADSNAMLDEVDYKIHFIHDAREVISVPSDMLFQLRRLIGKEHPNTGNSVIVGTKKSSVIILARSLLAVIDRVYKKDWGFQFADTLEEARGLLTESVNKNAS
jgi:hypothetical protein